MRDLVAGLVIGALATALTVSILGARRRRPARPRRPASAMVGDAPVPSPPEISRGPLLAATLVLFEVVPLRGRPRPPNPARALPRPRTLASGRALPSGQALPGRALPGQALPAARALPAVARPDRFSPRA